MHQHKRIEWFFGDFFVTNDISHALSGSDVVIHLVSSTSPKSSNDDFCYDIKTNLLGTISFLQLASEMGIKKVVFPSSGGTVYGISQANLLPETQTGNPTCSYGISKLAIEKYLYLFNRLYGLEYSILRISNPYGPYQRVDSGQGVIAALLYQAIHGNEIEVWGDGSIIRDYIYVDDVSRAFYKVAQMNSQERIFNIGSGVGYSINQILTEIEQLLGKPIKKRYSQGRILDVPANALEISKAKNILDWAPHNSLADGLEKTMSWLQAYEFD